MKTVRKPRPRKDDPMLDVITYLRQNLRVAGETLGTLTHIASGLRHDVNLASTLEALVAEVNLLRGAVERNERLCLRMRESIKSLIDEKA